MIKKLKYLFWVKICLLNVLMSGAVFADNVMNANQMLQLMASHQASFEYCKAKYPQQMTARFGQENDAFEALVKIHSFDKSSETFFRAMIHDHQDDFKKSKNTISQEIAKQTSLNDSDLCFWFVVEKTGMMAQVNKIIYDLHSLKFYLSMNDHWFEGDIDGYGLDCGCDAESDSKDPAQHQEKVKKLIEKAKVQMGKGTDFYMSHNNEDEKQAYIRVSIVSDETNDMATEHGDSDDLGLEFRNIQPTQSIPSNVEYITFFDRTGELTYECKINYINSSQTTCFSELIKKTDE
ncbi:MULTISPECIES: hypothetical protein [unclassified Acinetobacter]|uniref:hypothetical protein n=1 Tax=unclassified Acinetobacter TaxID=196816 RepID=UPI002578342E|nr:MULTISPECIES: hypothetical protein [unclassified Acinetobacter]MDM1756782.1 hypothetical protein [Acinetobacter sp. 256-1]MDM1761908.1 hypothetical protein [Acinetobacter sp. 251-1]